MTAGPPVPSRIGPFAEGEICCQSDPSFDGHAEPPELRHSHLGESWLPPYRAQTPPQCHHADCVIRITSMSGRLSVV